MFVADGSKPNVRRSIFKNAAFDPRLSGFERLRGSRLALTALLGLWFASLAWAEDLRVLPGHVPKALAGLTAKGRLESTRELKLAISLPLRNQAALDQLLRDIYNPASPNYRKYLTAAQFAERFEPTEGDYQKVVKFANDHGLTVGASHANRVILDVKGPVSKIEAALHISMQTYQHPKESRQFFASNREPSLDPAVPIQHISGLDDYALTHSNSIMRPVVPDASTGGSGPGGLYGGGDFRAAYLPGLRLTGAGESVCLVEFDSFYPSDIDAYKSQFGLLNTPLPVAVPVDGGISSPGEHTDEVSMNIELVMAMAPGLSHIYVYECADGSSSGWIHMLNMIATENRARQVSCSWVYGGTIPEGESIFQRMAAQGQSFFVGSGDNDAYVAAIPFPCDSPSITVVGGTTLTTTGAGGTYVSETVWNFGDRLQQGTHYGSGGGISTNFSIPDWQSGVSMSHNQGSTTRRNIPDVACLAEGIFAYYGNGHSVQCVGTSCAGPLWAAFTALVNQQLATKSLSPIGFLNPTLYAIGGEADFGKYFRDITTGDNFWPGTSSNFSAVAGYDLCTGWGSPTTFLWGRLTGTIPIAPTGLRMVTPAP